MPDDGAGETPEVNRSIAASPSSWCVGQLAKAWRPPRRTEVQPKWEVRLAHGDVSVAPDRVVEDGDQLVLQRLRTGKPSQDEARADIYALYQEAVARVSPGVETRLETLYLATGEIREVQVSEKSARTRLGHYEAAIEGILRREFPPDPNDRRCPRCPHYFICPGGADSPLDEMLPASLTNAKSSSR